MFKRHFKFCLYNNHPAYILKETKNSYIYLSITHSSYFCKIKNIPLKGARKENDTKRKYIIPSIFVADKNMFSKRKMKLKFDYADGAVIRDIVKNHLKNHFIVW